MQELLARLKLPIWAAALAIAGSASSGPVHAAFVVASCSTDNEIAAEQRAEIEAVALGFVRNMVGTAPLAAYLSFTAAAKQATASDKFVALVKQAVQPLGPFSNLRIAQTHLLKSLGAGDGARMLCGISLRPEDRVTVTVKPAAEQAHVLVEAQTRNNGFTFALWLIADLGWNVESFHIQMSSMVGKTAQDILALARTERQDKHGFNATILYATANQMAYRGPNLQLSIDSEIKKEISTLQVPPELQGNPPFAWKLGDDSFKVLNVGLIGVGGKIYLAITQEVAPWAADQDADQRNRALISDFIRAIPEYAKVFAGLVVGASESGGHRLFRTVHENDRLPQ
jgi:hypothetical protein